MNIENPRMLGLFLILFPFALISIFIGIKVFVYFILIVLGVTAFLSVSFGIYLLLIGDKINEDPWKLF